MSKEISWPKVIAGLYLISPFSPEDIATGGMTIIPSAAAGAYLLLNGLNIF